MTNAFTAGGGDSHARSPRRAKRGRAPACLAAALLAGLVGGCGGTMDRELVSGLRQSDWYHQIADTLEYERAVDGKPMPRPLLGLCNQAVLVAVVAEDLVAPDPNAPAVPLRIGEHEVVDSLASVRERELPPLIAGGSLPPGRAFRRGEVWAIYIRRHAQGTWFVRSTKFLREAPPDGAP